MVRDEEDGKMTNLPMKKIQPKRKLKFHEESEDSDDLGSESHEKSMEILSDGGSVDMLENYKS